MQDHRRRADHGLPLQRKVDGAGGGPGKHTLTQQAAPAGALPAPLRAKMESYFKTDFSAVRVREDARAKAAGAVAYAQGNELVFQPGKYDPDSRPGQELIGHELAHVVQQRQGRAAATSVQRYRDATIANVPFHISDGSAMVTRAGGEDPNKTFWAKLPALQTAQAKLASAGSLFHLQAKEIQGSFAKIEPKFVGPGSDGRTVYGKTQDKNEEPLTTQGPRTGMAADCNNAARMVMGILHEPTMTDTPPDSDHIERPMLGHGGTSRKLDLPEDEVIGTKGAHEIAGLTALTEALKGYRAVAATRPIQVSHGASVLAFMTATNGMDKPTAKAWTVFGTLRAQHQALYADLVAWAGLDSSIEPEVGDALVSWRRAGDTTAVNRRAYTAMIDVLTENIRNEGHRASMIEALHGRLVEQQLALDQIIATIATEDRLIADPEQPTKHGAAKVRRGDAERARLGLATNVDQLAVLHGALEGYSEASDPRELATRALASLGVAADTTWQKTVDTMNKSYGVEKVVGQRDKDITIARKVLGRHVEDDLTGAMGDNDLWNKHWGGVVMTDGGDYVTLENDASTKDEFGAVNAQWRFTMYGSKKPGQSFHAKMEESGDFGDRASTVRFRAPNQVARALPALSEAEQAEVDRLEAERVEAERQRDAERKRLAEERLRALGVPTGLTMGGCRPFALRKDGEDPSGGGGPPAVFKMEAGEINGDPALEAEADAQGAAAARHQIAASDDAEAEA